ncbi:MAG: 4Fe-4S dicluster domain-containing protein, partial [Planctomycetota bacterium]
GEAVGLRQRGPPRLVRDFLGREACVACFLCETVCPARCIRIVSEPAPAPGRERRPKEFEIDLLRCAFCGLCEEVCPADAIALSGPPLAPADRAGRARLGLEELLCPGPAGAR